MKEKNPFDFEQLMSQFDPAKVAEQFQQMLANPPYSQLNVAKLMESQKKTLESIQKANVTAVSGAQQLMKRQSEMWQQAMTDAGEAMQKLSAAEPTEAGKEQAATIEAAVKKSMENFEEISAMIGDIYNDISGQVEERMEQTVQELQDAIASAEESSESGEADKESKGKTQK